MMCRLWMTKACPFYGTIEHARCSSCRLGLDGPMVVGEMEALVAMNISESEIIPDAEVEERVLWIQKSKRQALFATNDSIKGASNVLHLGSRRLRVAAAEKLMTAIKSKNIDVTAHQGAIVIATSCPWLLRRELFKVGLCYHGQFGEGPY